VPGETAAKVVQTKEPQHKDDFDEWLARIICYAFSVPPQWATKAMNRATADNQSAQADEEGLQPTKEWVKDLIDEIVAEEFASPDLELHWLDEDEGDPETVLEGRLKVGALTLNEMRDALGLDPFDNAAADRPMVLTATGFVPIEANAGGQTNASTNASRSACANTQNASPIAKGVVNKVYDPEEPRVPKHALGGGQWTQEGNLAVDAYQSARDRNDSSAGGSADDANQGSDLIHVAAGLRCDGFPSGCQSGGSYGSSGMYNINGRVLCIDCAIKFFGLQGEPKSEITRTLDRFQIGK
jgi:hypothetical protein